MEKMRMHTLYVQIGKVTNDVWSQFTRSERILISLIALIVLGMTCIVANPGSSVGGSRNEQRLIDVIAIARAVHSYIKDKSEPVLTIGKSGTEICTSDATNCNGFVDLHSLTRYSAYLSMIPRDPQCSVRCHPNGTGYAVSEDDRGLVTVSAWLSEQNKLITATF